MRIQDEVLLDFDDVLIRPKRSKLTSRKDVSLIRKFKFLHSKMDYEGTPIMAANMDTVGNIGTWKILQEQQMFTCFHKFINNDKDFSELDLRKKQSYAFTFGINDSLEWINSYNPEYICLDVANGYTQSFVDFVKKTRDTYPRKTIIAGNVCTPEMTEELLLSGADLVKVGIGGGGQCLTRRKTGVGYPQLSAIIECADAAHGLKGHIVADGGCRYPCDVSKAFAAGADFVMLGSMLGAHEENSTFDEDGNAMIYGMSSSAAMKKHYGKVDSHRTSEGRITKLKNKGSLKDTLQDILGGVRSSCTYTGSASLKELCKRTTFVRVNSTINREYENFTIGE